MMVKKYEAEQNYFFVNFCFPFLAPFNPLTSSSPFFHLPSFLALNPFTMFWFLFYVSNMFDPSHCFSLRSGVPGGFHGAVDIKSLDFGRL